MVFLEIHLYYCMEVYLIRHGESEFNSGLTRKLDSSLSKVGVAQCCILGSWIKKHHKNLKEESIGYVSPYTRALQTASFIGQIANIEFNVDVNLREYHSPSNSHQTIKSSGGVKVRNKVYEFRNLNWGKDFITEYNFYKTEPRSSVFKRTLKFYENKIKKSEKKKIFIVTHAMIIKPLVEMCIGEKSNDQIMEEFNDDKKEIMNSKFITSNCGVYSVKDGKLVHENKIAYNQFEI